MSFLQVVESCELPVEVFGQVEHLPSHFKNLGFFPEKLNNLISDLFLLNLIQHPHENNNNSQTYLP